MRFLKATIKSRISDDVTVLNNIRDMNHTMDGTGHVIRFTYVPDDFSEDKYSVYPRVYIPLDRNEITITEEM